MLKVHWRKLSRFFEIKIELEDVVKIEMPGLLNDKEVQQLIDDMRAAADELEGLID